LIAGAPAEERQSPFHSGQEAGRRKETNASRGELDRQGQSIDPAANRQHRGSVVWRQSEVGLRGTGTLREQRDRIDLSKLSQLDSRIGFGNGERGDGKLLFPLEPQWRATGH